MMNESEQTGLQSAYLLQAVIFFKLGLLSKFCLLMMLLQALHNI